MNSGTDEVDEVNCAQMRKKTRLILRVNFIQLVLRGVEFVLCPDAKKDKVNIIIDEVVEVNRVHR